MKQKNKIIKEKTFVSIIVSTVLILLVKFVGFIKESILAYNFGTSKELDLYLMMMLLSFFFVTPVAGALSTMLTPLIKSEIFKTPTENAIIFSSKFIHFIFKYVLFLNVIGLSIFLLVHLFAEASLFGRLTYHYFLPLTAYFTGISIVCGGVLISLEQHRKLNLIPATVPVCIITFLVFFPHLDALAMLVAGTVCGYFLEMVFNFFATKNYIRLFEKLQPIPKNDEKVARKQIILLVASTAILNLNLVIDQIMAQLAGDGAVASVSFGNKITLGIISVLAVFWIVLYPKFSELIHKKEFLRLRKKYIFWNILIIGVGFPICCLLAIYSEGIIKLLFERGKFDSSTTQIVGQIQYYYLLHIPFYVLCMLSSRMASAMLQNSGLLNINLIALIVNVSLNFILINYFGVIGISIATLITYSVMSVIWLIYVLRLVNKQTVLI